MAQQFDNKWQEYQSLFRDWRKQHPAYGPQIYKIQKRFEQLEKDWYKLHTEGSDKKNKSKLAEARTLLEKAEKEIKLFKKYEFLANFAKPAR